MPGNENNVIHYLFKRLNIIELHHIGLLKKIEIPYGKEKILIDDETKIDRHYSDDSHKKADVYLNDIGTSIKQIGGSFGYNRLQRVGLIEVINNLKIDGRKELLQSFDDEVIKFHEGKLRSRDRDWSEFLSESDFKSILNYFMLSGSASKGKSKHSAEYILETLFITKKDDEILLYTFDEYFDKYKTSYRISIRRTWYGQISNSEHKRAAGLMKIEGNKKWVFDNVSGVPGANANGERWRKDVAEEDRKTVYFLMLTKV